MIVHVFFRLYTSYFSSSLGGGGGDMLSPGFILDLKMDSIVCISFVHDCIRRFSPFSFVLLTFQPLPGGRGWEHIIPIFLILDSKIGSILCILLVHDCIRLFSFVHILLFYLSQGRLGTCYPPFLILDSKMGSIVRISFVHDCIRPFSFVHLLLIYLSMGGERAGDTLYPFSDF